MTAVKPSFVETTAKTRGDIATIFNVGGGTAFVARGDELFSHSFVVHFLAKVNGVKLYC